MKTKVMYLATKLTVAVVLLALIAVKAFAGGTTNLKLVPHSAEKAIIIVDNADEISKLTIENLSGDVLYYQNGKIDEKNYSQLFDFKNLEDGQYKIIVKNRFDTNELIFSVKNSTISVETNELAFNPFITVEKEVLKVSLLNYNKAEISLSIENNEGEFFNKALGKEFNITTGLNIAKLNTGNYTAYISDGNNRFSYSFEK